MHFRQLTCSEDRHHEIMQGLVLIGYVSRLRLLAWLQFLLHFDKNEGMLGMDIFVTRLAFARMMWKQSQLHMCCVMYFTPTLCICLAFCLWCFKQRTMRPGLFSIEWDAYSLHIA